MSDEMDEIWALYADDGAQALDAAEEALDALETDPEGAAEHIAPLFRAIHTFKGNARVLGLRNVETLAHICEDLIGLVRDDGVAMTEELLDALLLTNDTLRNMLEETAKTRKDVEPEPSADLLDRLRDLYGKLSGKEAEAELTSTSAEPLEVEATEQEPEAEEDASVPAPAPAAPASPAMGGLGIDFGNLFDELGDSSSFGDDDDDIFDDESTFEQAEAADDTEEESVSISPAETLAEVIEEAQPLPKLSEDDGYREVFSGMVEDTLSALAAAKPGYPDDADSAKKAKGAADGLRFGADRLGLTDWVAVLDKFLEGASDRAALETLVFDLETLRHQQLDGPAPEGMTEVAVEPELQAHTDVAEGTEQPSGDQPTGTFSADEGYQSVFLEMVDASRTAIDTVIAKWDSESPRALRKEADALLFAAERMELGAWCEVLQNFMGLAAIAPDDAVKLNTDLGRLRHTMVGGSVSAKEISTEAPEQSFFSKVEPFYVDIAKTGQLIGTDQEPSAEERATLGDTLAKIASEHGFVRLEDAAHALGLAQTANAYHRAELDFYEQLVHVEKTSGYVSENSDGVPPSKLLGIWSAGEIFETLSELRKGLDPNKQETGAEWFPMFETLMRRVHYACVNFDVETASQLTMALVDLFSRVRLEKQRPDIILLQMARGYVDTMELVFDALEQGDTPDVRRIEQMFNEAANICFVANGVVTARSVEQRLQLPQEFHRVLSPESVKAAHDALEENQNFYIIRANLNDDDKMAEGFLEFITSDGLTMITNVTVFLDDGTLFDFLISGFIEEETVVERLAMIDPSGERLSMIQALDPLPAEGEEEKGTAEASADDDIRVSGMADGGTSLAMLEAVGAISASQAMVEHELAQIASEDLLQDITNSLRAAGVPALDPRVRNVLRDCIDQHSSRLMALHEAEAQLGNQLSTLQQESVEKRSRPADALLRPLKAYVAAQSHKAGKPATLRYAGGSLALDQLLIEDLRTILKGMVLNRLAAPTAPTEFHVSVEIEADHVRVVFSDNGSSINGVEDIEDVKQLAENCKGELRHANLPGSSGVRLLLRVPQHMIVLDGMVVRVGKIRYVLPIDAIQRILQTERVIPIAATKNQRMLNMDEEGMIPIRPLNGREPKDDSQLYVVVSSNDTNIAIPVDELVGQQLVLLRPLEGMLSSVRNMSGVAILSGGEVGMVVAVSQMAAAA